MLLLNRLEIRNFACFEHLEIELAATPEQPLTVVRAENGSGKTTFLRALRWVFYGERGLPGNDPARFSVHPAWWLPDDDGIETKITLQFETDGSTRFDAEDDGERRRYQLSRSVTTVAQAAAGEDDSGFRRKNEAITLMEKGPSGWTPRSGTQDDVEHVVELLLPWGLRDFFFLDADEATDFVGGREHSPLPKKQVVQKTTAAIDELLGLGVVQDATERIRDLHDQLQREVSRASGDQDLQDLQRDLDDLRGFVEGRKTQLGAKQDQRSKLDDEAQTRQAELDQELRDSGAHEQLQERLRETKQQLGLVADARNRTLVGLAEGFRERDFLAGLFAPAIQTVREELVPLYDQGLIPLTHVPFVQERLRTGTCLCGTDLSDGTPARDHVEQLLADSKEQEEQANLLGHVHDICGDCLSQLESTATDWSVRQSEQRAELGSYDEQHAELKARLERLDAEVSNIDIAKIQTLKGELDTINTQREDLQREIVTLEAEIEPKERDLSSLEKKVAQRQKREVAAADRRRAAELAALVGDVLERSYGRIQQAQVHDLSVRMNGLFQTMAANVSDDELGDLDQKATVRMIADVGIRPVTDISGGYEIYAKNAHGKILPPTEINGASRRVLALSFILALCKESGTETMLVADSLLNMMSGTVLTNTLEATATASRQPILLLTRQDLADSSEVELLNEHAGATYTLTGQWQAAEDGGGDVVRRHVPRQVSLCCACGPREYCAICERERDRDRDGWAEREPAVQGSM